MSSQGESDAPVRVLLIEADPHQREVLRLYLGERVSQVIACSSALEAFAHLESGVLPDLIVLDLFMPDMNGWEFRLEQKKEPSWAAIPVIVVSGDHSAQAAAMDAAAYLTKPLDADVFLQAVDRVLRELQRTRELANESEHQRLVSLGALVGGIAHEINNPLAFIFGSVDLLQRQLTSMVKEGAVVEPLAIATALRAVERAKQGAERIASVVRSASMFASADLDSIETMDVHELLESSIQVASNEIRHGAHLLRDYQDVPRVRGNPAKLGQVFLNLLLNAVYAIRASGGRDHVIRVGTACAGNHVLVSIDDSASSMEPSALAHMFEPAASVRSGTRLHLGLAVSREIVESMGGRIEVAPGEQRGATFRVLLPAQSRTSYPPPPPKQPTRVFAGREPIMIVDDEPLMCEWLAAALENDFAVNAFTSPRAALAALMDTDFAAILCDVMMPELNGIDLYERAVRERPALGSRFIFMTGGAFPERARLFLRQTGRPVLKKPCTRQDIVDTLAQLGVGPR